jgi:hypothetical protein
MTTNIHNLYVVDSKLRRLTPEALKRLEFEFVGGKVAGAFGKRQKPRAATSDEISTGSRNLALEDKFTAKAPMTAPLWAFANADMSDLARELRAKEAALAEQRRREITVDLVSK